METAFQIAGIAILTALTCCVIGRNSSAVSVMLSVAACVAVLFLALRFMDPVMDTISRVVEMSDVSGAVVAPVIKAAGIGVLVQISSTVCEDAGENTLLKVVELAGTVLALYVSLPLMTAVLDILEEILMK